MLDNIRALDLYLYGKVVDYIETMHLLLRMR